MRVSLEDEIRTFGELGHARLVSKDLRPSNASVEGDPVRSGANNWSISSVQVGHLIDPVASYMALPLLRKVGHSKMFWSWEDREWMEPYSVDAETDSRQHTLDLISAPPPLRTPKRTRLVAATIARVT